MKKGNMGPREGRRFSEHDGGGGSLYMGAWYQHVCPDCNKAIVGGVGKSRCPDCARAAAKNLTAREVGYEKS